MSTDYLTEVSQKFLATGDRFLPCDRDFAAMKGVTRLVPQKKVFSTTRTCTCGVKLIVPQDVWQMIATAKPSNYFLVIVMEQSDFVDLSPVQL